MLQRQKLSTHSFPPFDPSLTWCYCGNDENDDDDDDDDDDNDDDDDDDDNDDGKPASIGVGGQLETRKLSAPPPYICILLMILHSYFLRNEKEIRKMKRKKRQKRKGSS